jgi:hypothetical protein
MVTTVPVLGVTKNHAHLELRLETNAIGWVFVFIYCRRRVLTPSLFQINRTINLARVQVENVIC